MLSLRAISRCLDGPAPVAVDPEAYSILRAVWKTYPLAAAGWRAVVPPDQVAEERWAGLRDGVPLLDETAVRWDAAPLLRQQRRLLRLFRSPAFSRLEVAADLSSLLSRNDGEPIRWARLFLQARAGDSGTELVVGGYLVQPFLYAFARHALPRLSREARRSSRCPVCGGSPFHGYLDPETRRKVLVCGRCLCPWTAPRLQCPFCDTTLQEDLGYYFEEEAPRHRIETCTACRSLLPVTLEPESNRPFPLHDHLASMPLQAALERSSHDDQPS